VRVHLQRKAQEEKIWNEFVLLWDDPNRIPPDAI